MRWHWKCNELWLTSSRVAWRSSSQEQQEWPQQPRWEQGSSPLAPASSTSSIVVGALPSLQKWLRWGFEGKGRKQGRWGRQATPQHLWGTSEGSTEILKKREHSKMGQRPGGYSARGYQAVNVWVQISMWRHPYPQAREAYGHWDNTCKMSTVKITNLVNEMRYDKQSVHNLDIIAQFSITREELLGLSRYTIKEQLKGRDTWIDISSCS